MTGTVDELLDALLYEGYALYPYTPGAVKNATPFAPLPNSWGNPTMEVHFHFEVVAK